MAETAGSATHALTGAAGGQPADRGYQAQQQAPAPFSGFAGPVSGQAGPQTSAAAGCGIPGRALRRIAATPGSCTNAGWGLTHGGNMRAACSGGYTSAMSQQQPLASPGDYTAAALWLGRESFRLAQSGHLTPLPGAGGSWSQSALHAAAGFWEAIPACRCPA